MDKNDILQAPLSAEEMQWAMELADKLPDHQDLSFEEIKIMARISLDHWSKALLDKVRAVIDFQDFLDESPDEPTE